MYESSQGVRVTLGRTPRSALETLRCSIGALAAPLRVSGIPTTRECIKSRHRRTLRRAYGPCPAPPGNPHPLGPPLTLRQRRTLRRRVFHFQLGARPGASSTSSTLRAFKGEGERKTEACTCANAQVHASSFGTWGEGRYPSAMSIATGQGRVVSSYRCPDIHTRLPAARRSPEPG